MRSVSQVIDNVGAAISTVIQPYVVDVTFDNFALLAKLEYDGKVVQPDPSSDISWSIVSGKLMTGSYAGAKRFPGVEKQVFERAVLGWKNCYADCVLSGPDVMRARGPYAAFQLTDGIKQAAKMSITDEMGKQLYGDGSGTDLDGTANGIDDGVLYATYATVPRSSVTGWKSYVDGAGAAFTYPYLTNAIGKTTFGQSKPNLILSTQTLWNVAQNRAQTQQIFDANNADNNTANLGFTVVRHLGCDIVHDSKIGSGTVIGINTEMCELAVMPDRVWSWTGWDKVPGVDAYQAQFLFMGNLCVKSPRECFKLYNITE